MNTINTTKTNDVAELAKLTLSTILNIGQMACYRARYMMGKDLQNYSQAQVNAYELNQNRDKMIYHACLAGLSIVGLLAMGVSGLNSRN